VAPGIYDGVAKDGCLDVIFVELRTTEDQIQAKRAEDRATINAWTQSLQKDQDKAVTATCTDQVIFGVDSHKVRMMVYDSEDSVESCKDTDESPKDTDPDMRTLAYPRGADESDDSGSDSDDDQPLMWTGNEASPEPSTQVHQHARGATVPDKVSRRTPKLAPTNFPVPGRRPAPVPVPAPVPARTRTSRRTPALTATVNPTATRHDV
jgi:hypothetical protein